MVLCKAQFYSADGGAAGKNVGGRKFAGAFSFLFARIFVNQNYRHFCIEPGILLNKHAFSGTIYV